MSNETNQEFKLGLKIVRLKKELEAAKMALEEAEKELSELNDIRAEQQMLKDSVDNKKLVSYIADIVRKDEIYAREYVLCRELLTRKQLNELRSDLKVGGLI